MPAATIDICADQYARGSEADCSHFVNAYTKTADRFLSDNSATGFRVDSIILLLIAYLTVQLVNSVIGVLYECLNKGPGETAYKWFT